MCLPPNISDIESASISTAFLTTNGTVLVSGDNDFGSLGQGFSSVPVGGIWPNVVYPTPLIVPSLANVRQISGGGLAGLGDFYVARLADGTLRSWGANGSGQLGNGVISTLPNECKCIPTVQTVLGLSGVISVSAGGAHVLALKEDGTVWAWGDNYEGQLGNGTFADGVAVPAQVPGLTNIVAVAAGADHSLALRSDGTLWVWGDNSYGELGNGTRNPPGINGTPSPIQVPISGVVAIAAGYEFSIALKTDGTVWAWGKTAMEKPARASRAFPF